MPPKRPGMHNTHVRVSKEHHDILKQYCYAGAEKLNIGDILDELMATFIEQHIKKRLTFTEIPRTIPIVAAIVAHKIEPTSFEEPKNDGTDFC